MNSSELRQKYLDFFKSKGHKIIPSASLIPENDPTVLFTTAGMHPLVPYLLGQKHPEGTRLADAQKCIRTGDIDDVGDDTHLTFFEMLGNWSLGDYWKDEAIQMSWEFLTSKEWLGIDKNRLAVSVFEGDGNAPFDQEAFDIWKGLGISEKRIAKLGKEDNWWGPAGETGPCGPDTEMFYWKLNTSDVPEVFDPKNKNWVEIWNDVFMQYVKDENGNYNPAKQKNVDTGMGLERTLAVINGAENLYHTDVFERAHKKLHELLRKENPVGERIILDHLRAATFLLAERLEPSNLERGYVLRRLIRRAVRHGKQIGIEGQFCSKISKAVIETLGDIYPEIKENEKFIFEQLDNEEEKFEKTLENGLREFSKLESVSGKDAFNLFQTFGFPIEVTQELAKEKGVNVDMEEFKKELEKHQDLSRTASAGMFKGGLADNSEQTTKLHTAAHLMLAGLRRVLGTEVYQKGSNITAERLRFDFSHKEKMTPEQIKQVEDFVNDAIKEDAPVVVEEVTLDKAKELGAMGVFESKYGEKVKVYTIEKNGKIISREICGGPHVERTGILGRFRIAKEESSSSGVRRIKAVLSAQGGPASGGE